MPKIESTILALKMGRCFITNGPQFFIKAFADKNYEMGECIRSNSVTIRIEFSSTKVCRLLRVSNDEWLHSGA